MDLIVIASDPNRRMASQLSPRLNQHLFAGSSLDFRKHVVHCVNWFRQLYFRSFSCFRPTWLQGHVEALSLLVVDLKTIPLTKFDGESSLAVE